METSTTERQWANEQFDAIDPTVEACLAFDLSDDGRRYYAATRQHMTINLGLFSELSPSQREQFETACENEPLFDHNTEPLPNFE